MQLQEVSSDHRDALALVDAYIAELRVRLGEFKGPSIEELRADRVTLVGYVDDIAVACGSLRMLDSVTGEVKRMFVAAGARGHGHAKRILRALEEKGRALGCTRVVLDTAAPLHEAAALYAKEGWTEIARYNDNPYAARWFQKQLG